MYVAVKTYSILLSQVKPKFRYADFATKSATVADFSRVVTD